MEYHFHKLTDIKLLILKTIHYFKEPIPEYILNETILINNYANFFDLQQALYEMTENKLVTYYEENGGKMYSLTKLGSTALEGYAVHLPKSVCEKLYQTVRLKIREYENEISLIADYERSGDMDYTVKLGIMEGGYNIFTVTVSIFDEKLAKDICREFKRTPQTLYNELLSVLLKEPGGASGEGNDLEKGD